MYLTNESEARRVNKALKIPGVQEALGKKLTDALRKTASDTIKHHREEKRKASSLSEPEKILLRNMVFEDYKLHRISAGESKGYWLRFKEESKGRANNALVNSLIGRNVLTEYTNSATIFTAQIGVDYRYVAVIKHHVGPADK